MPLDTVRNQCLFQPWSKSFLRNLFMVTERRKVSLSFGIKDWLNASLDMSVGHTHSFYVFWGVPIGGGKRWRQLTKWNRGAVMESSGGPFIIVAKPVYSANISSVQFSCSVVSDSLQPHGLQHTRPPCPSPTPRAYSNSCPLSQWCHPTISSSVIPFSSRPQMFPASGSFQITQFFALGGQRFGASALASVLPMNIQDWFPLGWTGWISTLSKGLSSLFQHHSSKASFLQCSAFFVVQPSHPYTTTGKTIALTRWTFVGKVMSLLFNKLSLS